MKAIAAALVTGWLALAAQGQISGPFETLLLIDGQGDANDPLYAGWTQTLGFNTGLSKEVSVTPFGVEAQPAQLTEMGFTKVIDTSSAVIFDKLTQRRGQSSMRVVFVQADCRDRIEVWELVLTDVRFTSLSTQITFDALPTDAVSFVARTAEWRYIAPPAPAAGLPAEGADRLAYLRAAALAAAGTELYTRFDSFTGELENGTRTADYPGGVDSDGDGMSDGYETTYGLNRAANDATLDPDGDGMTNRMEFLADTDPHRPDSVLRVRATLVQGGVMELRWAARADRVYRIEGSPALGSAFTTVKTFTANADGEAVTTVSAAVNRFFRLRVGD